MDPLDDEHLIVQHSPSELCCGDKVCIERNYNTNLYGRPENAEEVLIEPDGSLKLAMRFSEGRTILLRANLCNRCQNLVLWNMIGRLKNKVETLEHRLYLVEETLARRGGA